MNIKGEKMRKVLALLWENFSCLVPFRPPLEAGKRRSWENEGKKSVSFGRGVDIKRK
jgi:hypothetical protein